MPLWFSIIPNKLNVCHWKTVGVLLNLFYVSQTCSKQMSIFKGASFLFVIEQKGSVFSISNYVLMSEIKLILCKFYSFVIFYEIHFKQYIAIVVYIRFVYTRLEQKDDAVYQKRIAD